MPFDDAQVVHERLRRQTRKSKKLRVVIMRVASNPPADGWDVGDLEFLRGSPVPVAAGSLIFLCGVCHVLFF